MASFSWASTLPDLPSVKTWQTVDFDELHEFRTSMSITVERALSEDQDSFIHSSRVQMAVARLLLDRLSDPLSSVYNLEAWSPAADVFFGIYADIWGGRMDEKFGHLANVALERDPQSFCDYVRRYAESAHCSQHHQIFEFLETEADFSALAMMLQAENLCDLNFVDVLALLMPGSSGMPAAELASNLWDEWGEGQLSRFHRELRRRMMVDVGLSTVADDRDLDVYAPEELEHFIAYAMNGYVRRFSLRLIGMMFATEFLVPQQLRRVIAGWRRVGLPDSKMEYLLLHFEGDVEHANGWSCRVIEPLLDKNPAARVELMTGVLQHTEILGRLYDRLYAQLSGKELIRCQS